jgi:hypothetical protein
MQVQNETGIDVRPPQSARCVVATLGAFLAVLGWSAIRPHDYFTWFLEVAPALIGLAVLASTYPKFRFTNLVYALIAAQAIILCIGGITPMRASRSSAGFAITGISAEITTTVSVILRRDSCRQ